MATSLKAISPKQLTTFLPNYNAIKLTDISKIPKLFEVKTEGKDTYLTREFIYSDFKEAFPQYCLFAKSCSKLQYYPQIFNVYNKVIVKCYTQKDGQKMITTKDLFMAFLLNQLQGNHLNAAYSRAIEQFPIEK